MLWLILLSMTACGPREKVRWDTLDDADDVDDVITAIFTLGGIESDREAIAGPHVAGGSLQIQAFRRGAITTDWRAITLDADIARVQRSSSEPERLLVDLTVLAEGTTDLFVVDGDGAVLDVQTLPVRAAAGVDLVPYEWLHTGEAWAVDAGELHTVHGADLSLLVTWTDRTGARLRGGKLLRVDADPPVGVGVGVAETSELDVLTLSIDRDAPLGSFDAELYAGDTFAARQTIIVHAADEIDALELVVHEQGASGAARALARTSAQEELLGAPVTFRWDGEEATGTVLLFEDGDPTLVEACAGRVCTSAELPGSPTGVADRAPASADGCGCATSGQSGAWLVVGALALARRRQSAIIPRVCAS